MGYLNLIKMDKRQTTKKLENPFKLLSFCVMQGLWDFVWLLRKPDNFYQIIGHFDKNLLYLSS